MVSSGEPGYSRRDVVAAAAMMLAAIALLCTLDAIVKWLSARYAPMEIVLFRSAGALPLILAYLWWTGALRKLRAGRPGLLALRSVLGAASLWCAYYAFGRMPLADAFAIGFTAPFFAVIVAATALRERVPLRNWLAASAGLAGALVVLRPDAGILARLAAEPAAALMLASAVIFAVNAALARHLRATENAAALAFYFTLACAAMSAPLAPLDWVDPAGWDWLLLAAAGVLGASGQVLMTGAFMRAPVSIVAPIDYLSLLFAVAIGYAIWDEVPPWTTIAGAAVIVASGLWLLRAEARR
ncbi:MAG: DMT family transporter [Alphaproteobacteria bacterium]|nr:DMT family transporter [Alphaproteobacteria bacterium]